MIFFFFFFFFFVILDNSNDDALPDDYVPDEFFVRSSEDKTINSNGRKLLDFCKQNGLRICNGRISEDRNFGNVLLLVAQAGAWSIMQ